MTRRGACAALAGSQLLEHPRVAQGVRLHPREIEELGDALVGRAHQLGVDIRRHQAFADLGVAVLGEEARLEGQAEQPGEAEFARVRLEPLEQGVPDTLAAAPGGHGQRAHLADVLPHHMEGTASDERTVIGLGDAELLHRLVEHHAVFAEQDAVLHERLDERLDRGHVGGAGAAHRVRRGRIGCHRATLQVVDTPPAEVSIDEALVARLIAEQHPGLLGPVSWLSSGWDNELFRLGDDYVVRMPRRALAVPLIEHEQRWLPELQTLVEVPIPVPVAVGRPGDGYPWPWSITRWLPGVPVAHLAVRDRGALVEPLARFVVELHAPASVDAPVNPVRGTPLAARDEAVRGRLASPGMPLAAELVRLWERACAAPPFAGPPVWIHGDLHPINVLADASGGLSAVIDFGDLAGADPACDLAAAWAGRTHRVRRRALFRLAGE